MTNLSPELQLWIGRLLPIVLGAGIGFVTNVIAIRMLFRPLKEYRIFGLRVPFTPGIIPKQRYALADSIGRMVSGQLLSKESVISHIRGQEFSRSLNEGISALLSQDSDDEVPPIVRRASSFLRNALTEQRLVALLTQLGTTLGRLTVSQIVPRRILRGQLAKLLDHQIRDGIGPRLVDELVLLTERLVEDDRSLDSIVSEDLRQGIVTLLEALYEPAVRFLFEWLRRPEIKTELTVRGKRILQDILRQLTSVQRFLLSAGQYDRTLEEKMPDIVSDLLNTVENALLEPANRGKVFSGLREALDRLTSQRLADIQKLVEGDFPALVRRAGNGLIAILLQERAALRLELELSRLVERHKNVAVQTIVRFLSGRRGKDLMVQFGKSAGSWVQSPGSLEKLLGTVYRYFVQDQSALEGSAGGVAGSVQTLLESAVPELLERFDVQTLVVNRINSLDVLAVENMLLSIMARHFKWINIFGALLGALIGSLQLFGL